MTSMPTTCPSSCGRSSTSSLVTPDLTANATRYRLLESVREFAIRRLDATSDTAATAARLGAWYLERLGPSRRHSRTWVSDVGLEVDNLRALVDPIAAADPTLAQELAFTIARFHEATDAYRAGIAELQQDISLFTVATPAAISLRTTLADLHLRLGDATAAKLSLAEAEALLHEVGSLPDWDDAAIERTRGDLACRSGDYVSAVDGARRSLAGDLSDAGRARMSNQLGIAAASLGDLDAAAEAFEQELDACRRLGDLAWLSGALSNLAEVELRRGMHAAAARHQRECLALAFELGSTAMVAFSLIVAARLEAARGDGGSRRPCSTPKRSRSSTSSASCSTKTTSARATGCSSEPTTRQETFATVLLARKATRSSYRRPQPWPTRFWPRRPIRFTTHGGQDDERHPGARPRAGMGGDGGLCTRPRRLRLPPSRDRGGRRPGSRRSPGPVRGDLQRTPSSCSAQRAQSKRKPTAEEIEVAGRDASRAAVPTSL